MKTYATAVMSAAILSMGLAETAGAAPMAHGMNPCVVAIQTVFAQDGAAVVNRFVAISYRESRHQAGAVNRRTVRDRRGRVYGRATGCLQVLPLVARNVGVTGDLRNPMVNAQAARRLWLRMGWSPWRVR